MTGKKSTPTRAVARAGAALPAGYASFLDGLKARIRAAQVKAALAVNAELMASTGTSGATSSRGKSKRAGERASSTGSVPTFTRPSLR
ncbi:MAG TPA: hypothetical protein VN894_07390 [Polyangiaceae bacterium]|nr:hypothetical protein [Polyangiaceae bacterium]